MEPSDMNGKGSQPRPVNIKTYGKNYERIFRQVLPVRTNGSRAVLFVDVKKGGNKRKGGTTL